MRDYSQANHSINLPPDPLCQWLGHRWESMQELEIALERERRGQCDGDWWGDGPGSRVRGKKARDYVPSMKPRPVPRAAKARFAAARTTARIEMMLLRAAPTRKRRAA